MARGTTLGQLLTDLRAECNKSLNPAHNIQVRDIWVNRLQRMQEWLWEDFNWPHLYVDRYLRPQAGQRFYDLASCKKLDPSSATISLLPAGDMKIDRITSIWIHDGNIWRPLHTGISDFDFNLWDSDARERAWPPLRWRITEDEQIEIFPIPDVNGDESTLLNMIKVKGTRNLSPLVNDSDTADLDDRMLVLYVAAEILDGEAAQKKLNLANQRMMKLRGNLTPRRRIRLFGNGERRRRLLRGPPTVYYRKDS